MKQKKPTLAEVLATFKDDLVNAIKADPQIQALLKPPDPREQVTVGEIVKAYLADAKSEVAKATYEHKTIVLNQFTDDLGHLRVSDCRPLDLKNWLKAHGGWKANTSSKRAAEVRRVFSWARKMRLVLEDPFTGITFRRGGRQRPMTGEEFRALLGAATSEFRRVLLALRLTGARPGELAKSKWADVDFERSVITLYEHKTSRTMRNPKPRLIALHPTMVKLLRWIQTHQRPHPIEALRKIFLEANGEPIPAEEYRNRARMAGVPVHDLYQLSRALGAKARPEGSPGHGGRWVWELPRPDRGMYWWEKRGSFYANLMIEGKRVVKRLTKERESSLEMLKEIRPAAAPAPLPFRPRKPAQADQEHIFLDSLGNPWHKNAFSLRMQRLRKKTNIPPDCRLYGLRHAFGTDCVRAGINLKVVAELMGHTTTAMTEHYVHIAGDIGLLRDAVGRVFTNRPARDGADPPAGQ